MRNLTKPPTSEQSCLVLGNFLSRTTSGRGPNEDVCDQLENSGWQVIRASYQHGRLARLADMVQIAWRRRRDYRVCVVEVYSGLAFVWAFLMCALLRMLNKPYILNLQGGNLPVFSQRWPLSVQILLQSAHTVTAPSGYMREHMASFNKDILVIPNGIHIPAYSFKHRTSATPHLVWLRAFNAIYRPEVGAQVVALLVERFPAISLTMFGANKGDGSLQHTQSTAGKLGVSQHIHFPGGIPKADVPRLVGEADIFLNTTSVESFGVSVIEAAALGLCVVTTNVGGLAYIWENEDNALLVPPDDPKAMAAAVERILTDSSLAERLSRNGRAMAEQFDWQTLIPQWEILLLSAIESSRHNRVQTKSN